MLKLSLNGEPVELADPMTLSALLVQYTYQAKKIAVAINGEFVSRSQYDNTHIHHGDQVDVIQAVGGG